MISFLVLSTFAIVFPVAIIVFAAIDIYAYLGYLRFGDFNYSGVSFDIEVRVWS